MKRHDSPVRKAAERVMHSLSPYVWTEYLESVPRQVDRFRGRRKLDYESRKDFGRKLAEASQFLDQFLANGNQKFVSRYLFETVIDREENVAIRRIATSLRAIRRNLESLGNTGEYLFEDDAFKALFYLSASIQLPNFRGLSDTDEISNIPCARQIHRIR